MANESIEISKKGVDTVVSDLRDIKKTIEDCKKTIDSELQSISDAWKGADAIAYVQRMKEDYAVILERYVASLGSYIDFLEKVFQQYKDYDDNLPGVEV